MTVSKLEFLPIPKLLATSSSGTEASSEAPGPEVGSVGFSTESNHLMAKSSVSEVSGRLLSKSLELPEMGQTKYPSSH